MSLSPLRADVFLAPPIPAVPPSPIPDNITPLWSPTAATLITSAHEAVLVDPLFTKAQGTALADWIETRYPDKRLTYIYITHGHGDHFFGLSTILARFPNATPVATAGTVAHMEEQLTPESQAFWNSWFPGNQISLPTASPPAQPLPTDDLTIKMEGGRHTLHAVAAGHSDTDSSTFLWVPELELAVTGDIVYNGAYSYLAESLTPALREQWIAAIDKVASFHPKSVVVGHKLPGTVDGAWALDATRKYIRLWGRLAEEARDARDLFERVRRAVPDYTGEFVLWWSCLQQFPGNATVGV
ncbi:hypothetical protein G7Y79_00046g082350 [Physcia stellaris]|nr:hypothetical protein G7Y79_00046g082350 [Physcia stellaris]